MRPPLLNASSVSNAVPFSAPVFRMVNKMPPATPSRSSQSQHAQSATMRNKQSLSASATNLLLAADNTGAFSTPHGPSPNPGHSSAPRKQTHEPHQQHKQQLSLLLSPTVRAASMSKFRDDRNDSDGEEGCVDVTSPTRNLKMTAARSHSRRAVSKTRKALHPARHTPLPLSTSLAGASSSSTLSLSSSLASTRKNNRDLFGVKRDLSKGSLLPMNLAKSPLLSFQTLSGSGGAMMQFGNNDIGGNHSDDDEEMPEFNRLDESTRNGNSDNALFRVLNSHKANQNSSDSMDQDEVEKEDQNRVTPTPELLGADDTANPIFHTPHHDRQQQELNQ
ncbi:hypothetical protein HK100_010525, partial [Physocladia obscura]